MLPARASIHTMGKAAVDSLYTQLEEYDYDRGDSLLALGDPALMAMAFAIVGRYNDHICVLCWDRRLGKYLPAHIHLKEE